MGNEFPTQGGQAQQPHVHDQGAPGPDQRVPVQVDAAVLEVAGDEQAGIGVIAVGERNSGVSGNAASGGNPRYYLERDAGRGQRLDFFAAAAKYERVAAFEP